MRQWRRDPPEHCPWHVRFRRSLRGRLVAMFVLFALAVTLVFLAGMRAVISGGWQDFARPLVVDYVDRLAAEVGDPPEVARAQALVARLPITVSIDGPRVQWRSHPRREWTYRESSPLDSWTVRRTADGHTLHFGIRGWATGEERPHAIGWLTLAALLGLTALAFGYVRHLFRPLDDIRAGAERYGSGDFSQPIPLRRRDELGDLADQVNTMATNLRAMLEGQRGLLLAISHELRSPLTRARLNAELVAGGAERDALMRDLGQMRDLIAGLLEGERLARGHEALATEPMDLNALVRSVIDAQFADRDLSVSLAPEAPLLQLDRARAEMLVRNLIDNALRHGGAAARPPEVRITLAEDRATLTVRDHGPGLPEEQLARLAEPFYRPDVARTRSTGGVGLGLYLCRLVARSHGGELSMRNAEPGLEVSVCLPLKR